MLWNHILDNSIQFLLHWNSVKGSQDCINICIMLIKQLVVLCILILHDLTFYGFAFKDMLGRNCPSLSYIKMVSLQPFCYCVSSYCVCIMYVCISCICGYVCRHRAHSILSPPFSVIPYSFPLAHSKHNTTRYFHYILPFCTLLNEDWGDSSVHRKHNTSRILILLVSTFCSEKFQLHSLSAFWILGKSFIDKTVKVCSRGREGGEILN